MVEQPQNPNQSRKSRDLVQYLVLLGCLVLLNVLAARFFFRVDLTEDQRYTIAPATKNILRDLDKKVLVDVYLEGEFPSGFRRLQTGIRETLEEFRVYAGTNMEYRFIDPGADEDLKKRNEKVTELARKGLQPTNLFAMEGDKKVEKLIFPGAIVSVQGKEMPVMLLKGNRAATPDEQLNQSIEGVEYELASAIQKLTNTKRKRIAFLDGHGELPTLQMGDMMASLNQFYEVVRVNLPKKENLQGYDLIIMARPTEAFSEEDKFKIDQFIMNGGKALFFINALNVHLDSVRTEGTFAFPYSLNLDDLFFKYGVRFNGDLIQDINAGSIPMVVGFLGDRPQTQLVPWRFHPLINTFSKHPITRNIDIVATRFVGTIDTVKAAGVVKTPLLSTSPYTRVAAAPASVNLNEARIEPTPDMFSKGSLPVGYLLEGSFQSVFTNRPVPEGSNRNGFRQRGDSARLAVFSDGDLIRNDVNPKTNRPMELGLDRYSGARYANKELIMNTIDYLLDESRLISVRNKEITMRPLDRVKIKEERSQWQFVNLGMPLLLLFGFGLGRHVVRKRKYTRFD
ncbi:gliding motility-associated ABC transporter substrate-binding protein GldG [soil metagenome]